MSEQVWFNSIHPYRRKITVKKTNIAANLTNFPVFVPVKWTIHKKKIQGGANPAVYFYDPDGNILPYELDYAEYVPSVNAYNYYFWVRVPLLRTATGSDNILWLYYGGASKQAEEPELVFSGYDLVTHMNDRSSTQVAASVGPVGTKKAVNQPTQVAGVLAQCQQFETVTYNDYINFTNTVGGYTSGNFTIEAWAKIPRRAGNEHIIGRQRVFGSYDPNDPLGGWFVLAERFANGDPRKFFFYFREQGKGYGNYVNTVWNVWPDNQWFHFAIVRNGTNVSIFINGISQEVFQYADAETLGVPVRPLFVGRDNIDAGGYQFNGWIDEVRLSPTNRSAEWLKFEVANMSSADNELVWGDAEYQPREVVLSPYTHHIHPVKGWSEHFLDKVAPAHYTSVEDIRYWPAGRVGILQNGRIAPATPSAVNTNPAPMPLYLLCGPLDDGEIEISVDPDGLLRWVNSVPGLLLPALVATGGYELQTTEFNTQGTYYCNTPLTVTVDSKNIGGVLTPATNHTYGGAWICGVCSLHCQEDWKKKIETPVPTSPVGTNASGKTTLTFWSYFLPKVVS